MDRPGTEFSDDTFLFQDTFVFASSVLASSAARGKNKITGTSGDDTLNGTGKGDIIRGLKGDDRLDGAKGNDNVDGGAGKDKIFISPGKDKIDGGTGRDTLDASRLDGGVVINATATGKGFPSVDAQSITLSDGTIQSVVNIENFLGSKFGDTFYGDANGGVLKGRGGDDWLESTGIGARLVGGGGKDRLRADGDNSKLMGGTGADNLSAFGVGMTALGGRGDDQISFAYDLGSKVGRPVNVIRGGAGNDTLTWLDSDTDSDLLPPVFKVFGGAGADVFDFGFYESGTIQDFQPGIDKVDLTVHLSRETPTFAQLKGMITDTAAGAVLKLDFDSVVNFEFVFKGVTAADFVDGDFIF